MIDGCTDSGPHTCTGATADCGSDEGVAASVAVVEKFDRADVLLLERLFTGCDAKGDRGVGDVE